MSGVSDEEIIAEKERIRVDIQDVIEDFFKVFSQNLNWTDEVMPEVGVHSMPPDLLEIKKSPGQDISVDLTDFGADGEPRKDFTRIAISIPVLDEGTRHDDLVNAARCLLQTAQKELANGVLLEKRAVVHEGNSSSESKVMAGISRYLMIESRGHSHRGALEVSSDYQDNIKGAFQRAVKKIQSGEVSPEATDIDGKTKENRTVLGA